MGGNRPLAWRGETLRLAKRGKILVWAPMWKLKVDRGETSNHLKEKVKTERSDANKLDTDATVSFHNDW